MDLRASLHNHADIVIADDPINSRPPIVIETFHTTSRIITTGSPFKKSLAAYSAIVDSAFDRQCADLKTFTHSNLVDVIRSGWPEASVASLPAIDLKYLILRDFRPHGPGGSDDQEIRSLLIEGETQQERRRRIEPSPAVDSSTAVAPLRTPAAKESPERHQRPGIRSSVALKDRRKVASI